tara:strand:- start:491 stop:1129 length:639 start_codon:yes stop_codon:yes gene_type:complete
MESLKDNSTNREFFVLYSQMENKSFDSYKDAEDYLNESIKTLKSKKNKVNLKRINGSIKKYSSYIGKQSNRLYESMDTLIFNENVLDIEKRIEAKKLILKNLQTKKSKPISENKVPTSLLINLSTKNFNQKYENLTENDKVKFKTLMNKDMGKLEKEINGLVEEVSEKLDKLISESTDSKLLNKLEETKKKIQDTKKNKVSFYKIKELNKTL